MLTSGSSGGRLELPWKETRVMQSSSDFFQLRLRQIAAFLVPCPQLFQAEQKGHLFTSKLVAPRRSKIFRAGTCVPLANTLMVGLLLFAALFSSSFASRCFFCCCVRACSLLLLFCHSLLFCLLLPPPLVLGIAGLFCHSPALPFCLCFGLLLPPNRFSSARLLLLFPPQAQGSTFNLQRCPPHFHYC